MKKNDKDHVLNNYYTIDIYKILIFFKSVGDALKKKVTTYLMWNLPYQCY